MRRQLNAACVVVVCCGLVSCQESEVPETTNETDERAIRQFVGAWSLKSIERRGADGGPPCGRLIVRPGSSAPTNGN